MKANHETDNIYIGKCDICGYIRDKLGKDSSKEELGLVKQRVALMLHSSDWDYLSAEQLLSSMEIINESINVIIAARVNK